MQTINDARKAFLIGALAAVSLSTIASAADDAEALTRVSIFVVEMPFEVFLARSRSSPTSQPVFGYLGATASRRKAEDNQHLLEFESIQPPPNCHREFVDALVERLSSAGFQVDVVDEPLVGDADYVIDVHAFECGLMAVDRDRLELAAYVDTGYTITAGATGDALLSTELFMTSRQRRSWSLILENAVTVSQEVSAVMLRAATRVGDKFVYSLPSRQAT